MHFVCLSSPAWRTVAVSPPSPANPGGDQGDALADQGADQRHLVALATTLLSSAPRVCVGQRGNDSDGANAQRCIWADARGLNARVLAHALLDLVHDDGVRDVSAGIAATPVAAQLAALNGAPGITVVDPGEDRQYISLFPVEVLGVPPQLKPLLFGIGVKTCGELAALTRESVEVRLGPDAVRLWRLARGDDDRAHTLFAPMPRELPHATLDWMDYEVTDPARLLFVINALLENVCDALTGVGQGARELAIHFALTNNSEHVEPLRASRPTANRHTWIRLIRTAMERIELPCAVTGVAVRVTRVSERDERQTDLFDRGLATAAATEDVLARLVEDQGRVIVVPSNSAHPLLEQRTRWMVAEQPANAYRAANSLQMATVEEPTRTVRPVAALTLQLAPDPRSIAVETVLRRDHFVPVRYRDAGGWHEVVQAAGPDRVSGGRWDGAHAYAREYFRCVTRDGALVWLFRSLRGKASRWFLHGWWD